MVSGATWPVLYCLQLELVVWPLAEQRSDTLPAAWGGLGGGGWGPTVLMITLLPLLPVLNQSAVSTEAGHWTAVSERVANPTAVWRRQRTQVVARTHTELLPLAS